MSRAPSVDVDDKHSHQARRAAAADSSSSNVTSHRQKEKYSSGSGGRSLLPPPLSELAEDEVRVTDDGDDGDDMRSLGSLHSLKSVGSGCGSHSSLRSKGSNNSKASISSILSQTPQKFWDIQFSKPKPTFNSSVGRMKDRTKQQVKEVEGVVDDWKGIDELLYTNGRPKLSFQHLNATDSVDELLKSSSSLSKFNAKASSGTSPARTTVAIPMVHSLYHQDVIKFKSPAFKATSSGLASRPGELFDETGIKIVSPTKPKNLFLCQVPEVPGKHVRHGRKPGPGEYSENDSYVYLGRIKKKFTAITYKMAPFSDTYSRVKINEFI